MSTVFYGVFAALCWGIHDLFARTCANRIGPWRMAFWVMTAGGVLLLPYFAWRGFPDRLSGEGLILSLALGIAYAAGVGGIYKAFSLGPISLVAPLTSAYPALIVGWGLLHGLAPTPLQLAAMVLAVTGALVVGRFGDSDASKPLGRRQLAAIFLFCLLCIVGFATAVVIGQKAAPMVGEVEAAWISRATAALAVLPFVVGEAGSQRVAAGWWPAILAMGLLDILGLIAVSSAGHLADKEFAAIGTSAYGAVAVVLAMIFLKEKVVAGQWIGIVMIALGVAGLSWQ